ncbi:hypothetical protein AC578_3631 [Pseudocercospora eumusae]|uniref:DUF6919 domain-containing protein n=1 Tax=Pseudocercospora eumusae TaxID=321146 RepID=A0A139HPT4_9PEZI|nr:hypothetical protein AC578_3631 [Pseudocercospora eumusae]
MGAFSSKITKARTKHFDKDAWTGPWRFAENWSDLLDANRAFLRGETNRSPYYRSNISPETQSLVPGLLELHEFGFLTYSSQPFRDDEDVKFSRCECGQRAAYEQIKQRAFLSFLVPASALGGHAQRFRAELESEHEIHVATLEYAGSCKEGTCPIPSIIGQSNADVGL